MFPCNGMRVFLCLCVVNSNLFVFCHKCFQDKIPNDGKHSTFVSSACMVTLSQNLETTCHEPGLTDPVFLIMKFAGRVLENTDFLRLT